MPRTRFAPRPHGPSRRTLLRFGQEFLLSRPPPGLSPGKSQPGLLSLTGLQRQVMTLRVMPDARKKHPAGSGERAGRLNIKDRFVVGRFRQRRSRHRAVSGVIECVLTSSRSPEGDWDLENPLERR